MGEQQNVPRLNTGLSLVQHFGVVVCSLPGQLARSRKPSPHPRLILQLPRALTARDFLGMLLQPSPRCSEINCLLH